MFGRYNICYEVSAIIFLFLVYFHINFDKTIESFRNRFFAAFTWIGILDILMDMISTVLIAHPETYPTAVQQVGLQLFYVMQLLLPFMLYLYVLSLRGTGLRRAKPHAILAAIPMGLMLLLVVLNPWLKLLFCFDETGRYMRCVLYPLMYLYGLGFMLLCLLQTIIFRKDMDARQRRIIWEFVLVAGIPVAVQMIFNDILLTGFGIAGALIILLLTLQNPNRRMDPLTDAYDIRGLQEKLQLLKNRNTHAWMIVLSLDNFKRINNLFGMEAGDRALVEIAQMLQGAAQNANVFRFVGDRFVTLVYSEKEYRELLARLNQYFDDMHSVNGSEYQVSACVCSMTDFVMEGSTDYFLPFIEYIVQQARRRGPNSRLVVDEELKKDFQRYRRLESILYEATANGSFTVCYQPVFSMQQGCYQSAEALARLHHPELGNISPAEFIPIAEKNGLISQIDRCVFEQGCAFLSENPIVLETLHTVKFNLSPADFLNIQLAHTLVDTIRQYGLDPHKFHFEITETVATQYGEELSAWAEILRKAGCGLCLDDFGSGYANLDSVLRLPFRVVKLDRSMLLAAMQSPHADIMYRHVVQMLFDLHETVVAEGAETQEQIDYLCRAGIDQVQGYFFAKPMKGPDLVKVLREQQERD